MKRIAAQVLVDLLQWGRLPALAAAQHVMRHRGLATALARGLLVQADVDRLAAAGLVTQTPTGPELTYAGRDVTYALTEWFQQHHRPWDFMRDSLPALRGRRLLDLGCGEGFLVVHALRRGAALSVGVDVVPEVVQFARAALSLEPPDRRHRGMVVRAAAEALPFDRGSFDLITARVAFNYFDLPRPVPEIARVLRPTGRVYMTVETPWHYFRQFLSKLPSKAAVVDLFAMVNAVPSFFGWPVWRFNLMGRSGFTAGLLPTALRRWFSRCGFRIVAVRHGARQIQVPGDQRKAAHGLFLIVLERIR